MADETAAPVTPAAPVNTKRARSARSEAVKKNRAAIKKLKYSTPPAGIGQTLGIVAFNGFPFYILDIKGPKISAGWIDTTSMATEEESSGIGNKPGVASMYNDPGEIDLECLCDLSDWPPPFGWASEAVVTYTAGPGAVARSFTATMISYEEKGPLEGKAMSFDCKLRISGAIV